MEVENIGDWLYFLFIIIAGISSLFSSKKKGKKVQKKELPIETEIQPEEEVEQPEKGFWDILQEMQKQEETVQPKPQPSVVKPKKEEPFQKEESFHKRHKNYLNKERIEEEATLQEIELTHAAELRKAVIYSEILNRKY